MERKLMGSLVNAQKAATKNLHLQHCSSDILW